MDANQNPWGVASLVLGGTTWFVWIFGTCAGMVIPFLSILVMGITWFTAFAGLVTGVIGYRTAMVNDGIGRGASLGGIALNVTWLLVQLLMFLAVFLTFGSLFFLVIIAAIFGES